MIATKSRTTNLTPVSGRIKSEIREANGERNFSIRVSSEERVEERSDFYSDVREVRTYVANSKKSLVAMVERKFIDDILKKFDHLADLNVLDIGTGPGWIPIALAKAKPNWKITALDASPLMLEMAQEHATLENVNIHWLLAKANKISTPSESYDLVISHLAFHEFPDAVDIVKEIERVLKPGGQVVIQDLNRPRRWEIPFLVAFATIANRSRKMGRQYKESLQAAYRAAEMKTLFNYSNLVSNITTSKRFIGGVLRAWATKSQKCTII